MRKRHPYHVAFLAGLLLCTGFTTLDSFSGWGTAPKYLGYDENPNEGAGLVWNPGSQGLLTWNGSPLGARTGGFFWAGGETLKPGQRVEVDFVIGSYARGMGMRFAPEPFGRTPTEQDPHTGDVTAETLGQSVSVLVYQSSADDPFKLYSAAGRGGIPSDHRGVVLSQGIQPAIDDSLTLSFQRGTGLNHQLLHWSFDGPFLEGNSGTLNVTWAEPDKGFYFALNQLYSSQTMRFTALRHKADVDIQSGIMFSLISLPERPVEGCILWLDATQSSTLSLDGSGRILHWYDLSGRGNHVVQEVEFRRPVKGDAAVRFSGGEWLTLSRDPGVEAEAMTVVVVFETEEEHPQRLMGILGNGGHAPSLPGMTIGFNGRDLITQDNAAALMLNGTGGQSYEVGGSSAARFLQINRLLAPQVGNLLTVQWQSGADPFARIFYFGEDRSEGFPEFPGALRLDSLGGLTVGAADASGAFPFMGKIREVLVFDRVLTDQERVRIETALAEKHAITRPSEFILDPRAERISLARANAISGDGALLRLAGGVLYESRDGGPWVRIVEGARDPSVPDIAPGGLLTRTHEGTLISVTANRSPAYWTQLELIDGTFNSDEAMSHVYAFRSVDGGATWQDATLLQTDYCGAIRDIIVTSQGHIVVSVQAWDREHERHITVIHVSTDDGLSYHRADVDNGIGRGLHDGFFESTVTELGDGRIWMLGRTSLGVFWESFSQDGGLSWSAPEATQIDAGGYPGFLLRLASGVQVLAWNRYYPVGYEGRDDLINIAGVSLFWGTTATSRYNSQMSVMFSADDGATWTDPVVIAAGRQNFAGIRYPHLYEPSPGEIYLWAGTIALRFHEAEFILTE